MKTKTLNLLLCLIAVTSSVLISCSEDLGLGNKIEQDEAKLVSVAKLIYQNQGNSVCLPNPKANKNNASRSSFSYIAELDPLWNEAFTYNQGTETVVIVPLNSDDDIRSTLSIIDGEETIYQFAKVFSRMIIKPNDGENGIYVLSYMPESNYSSSYTNLEDEMGYNPSEFDFTGLIVSSTLNGEVIKGFLYKDGVLNHYFAPETPECHDHSCTENHNHNHEHKGLSLRFNLQNANQSRSTTYSSRSEDYLCPICFGQINNCECLELEEICENCSKNKNECICPNEEKCGFCNNPINKCTCFCPRCGVIKESCMCGEELCKSCGFLVTSCICGNNICNECGRTKKDCICGDCVVCGQKSCICPPKDEKKEQCLLCGAIYDLAGDHNCGSTPCPVCKSVDCICNPSPTEPCKDCGQDPCVCYEPNKPKCDICKHEICVCCKNCNTYPCECCEKCGEYSCICVTNYTPILYAPHERDYMLSKGLDECVESVTCSALAALETACSIYESTVSQEELNMYYTYLYDRTLNDYMELDINSDFMQDLFITSTTQNIENTIENGMPVIVRFGNCYITVVGIQYDGDIIYANHDNGNLYAVEKDYFNNYENIVIEGVPHEIRNPYLSEK